MDGCIFPHLSNSDYHSLSYLKEGWISSSLLKAAREGYQSFESCIYDEFKQTPSMKFGSILHAKILEPEQFEREWSEKLTKAETEKLEAVLKRFPTNVLAQLKACEGELSLLLNDSKEKVRFDAINLESGVIFDVKTTSSFDSFRYAVNKYGYDLQAYFYLKCAEKYFAEDFTFVWVAVETVRPYRVQWYQPKDETLIRGEEKYHEALAALETYKKGYDKVISDELESI